LRAWFYFSLISHPCSKYKRNSSQLTALEGKTKMSSSSRRTFDETRRSDQIRNRHRRSLCQQQSHSDFGDSGHDQEHPRNTGQSLWCVGPGHADDAKPAVTVKKSSRRGTSSAWKTERSSNAEALSPLALRAHAATIPYEMGSARRLSDGCPDYAARVPNSPRRSGWGNGSRHKKPPPR